MIRTATYSPEDDKLRLSCSERLPEAEYHQVKHLGFQWAPMQKVFYAVWSPGREDLLLDWCDEIEDEDKTLIERAEERSERFDGYSESRKDDAIAAKKAVDGIMKNIPFGQPILVGHHSERHARRDAEKIRTGLTKTAQMWETSEYWSDRAAACLRHAKYKREIGPTHRRIKGLESDIRIYRAKFTPDPKQKEIMQRRWNDLDLNGVKIPHVWCGHSRGGSWVAVEDLPGIERHYTRWIKHCQLRLEYERALLGEVGGLITDKFQIEPGGQVLVRGEWVTVLKVNRGVEKTISSVRTTKKGYGSLCSIEVIQDYRPATEEDTAKAKKANAKGPLCNYPGEGFEHVTSAQYQKRSTNYRGHLVIPANDKHGVHRVHRMLIGWEKGWKKVFLTDAKVINPPEAKGGDAPVEFKNERIAPQYTPQVHEESEAETEARLARESLKSIKVISANQLFVTPEDEARRLAQMCEILPGHRVFRTERRYREPCTRRCECVHGL